MDLDIRHFSSCFDLVRFKKMCMDLYSMEYSFCYKDFKKSANRCIEIFRESGMYSVECIPFQADGKTICMDFIMPQAWDVEEASLSIVSPVIYYQEITSRRRDVFCVANRCPPTPPEGITAELVLWEDVKAGASAEGKIVLTIADSPRTIHHKAVCSGAVAIVSGFSESDVDFKDNTYWVNGYGFPYWYHTKDDKVIPCFSIPPTKAGSLVEILRQPDPVILNAKVDSRLYDGELYTVTGIIPGIEKEEIVLLAHIYEPFMNDNHSGAAALAEIARMLASGINSGTLARPRKTVRFLTSMEQYGVAHYYCDADRRERTKLAINLDCISYDARMTCQPIAVISSPASFPACTDLLLHESAARYLSDYVIRLLEGELDDDSFVADRTIGIPSQYLISLPRKCHHNSIDQFDFATSWKIAEGLTCYTAAYVHKLAAAGNKEIEDMLEEAAQLAVGLINKKSREMVQAVRDGSISAGELAERLYEFSGWQVERIKSFGGFDKSLDLNRAVEQLINTANEEKMKVLEEFGEVDRPMSNIEKVAQSMVITRNGIGFPASQASVPCSERFENPLWSYYIFNWFDGNTDILTAMRKTSIYLMEAYPAGDEIECFVEYIKKLERYGYVKIEYVTGER